MLKIDKEEFDRNLLLTQIYCEMQLANTDKPVAEILRSFNPEYNGKKVVSFNNGKQNIWEVDPLAPGMYDWLFDGQMVNKKNLVESVYHIRKFNGRVLVAGVDAVIPDGASETESEGFIDANDCPPIDTWFYKTHDKNGLIFYAWIPEQFVKLTQDAHDVNLLECFTWEEDYVSRKEVGNPQYPVHPTQYIVPKKNKRDFFKVLTLIALITLIWYLLQKLF